jgi:hypothetical protein
MHHRGTKSDINDFFTFSASLPLSLSSSSIKENALVACTNTQVT